MTRPLLAIETLEASFVTERGLVRAVDGISFHIDAGEVVAVVGESGSGKSVTAMSILGLLPRPPAVISGRVLFEGRDLMGLSEKEMSGIRGNQIGMVFQEPMTSLNPVLTVGDQIAEAFRLHQGLNAKAALAKATEMLAIVGIPAAAERTREYPHQLSGGMRQRVMIAMALACRPKLLIADEPTTALDVTVQAQILDLVRGLKAQFGSAILLITHDLGVVAEMADRVIVMYAGRKVEEAPVGRLFAKPAHPYTQALMAAIPVLGASGTGRTSVRLAEMPTALPSRSHSAVGCAFAPRCPKATSICWETRPAFELAAEGHLAACHHINLGPA